jgi:hypothetical protein
MEYFYYIFIIISSSYVRDVARYFKSRIWTQFLNPLPKKINKTLSELILTVFQNSLNFRHSGCARRAGTEQLCRDTETQRHTDTQTLSVNTRRALIAYGRPRSALIEWRGAEPTQRGSRLPRTPAAYRAPAAWVSSSRALPTNQLHGFSKRANYTDPATEVCRQSYCQLLRIEGCRMISAVDPLRP